VAAPAVGSVTDRWERMTAIFNTARTLDATERGEYLDRACGDAGAIRDEIEELLAADEDEGAVEPRRVPGAWTNALAAALAINPGDVLKARYRIDDQIALGGQGLVYRGTDIVLDRPVVVKVMRSTYPHNEAIARRFEQEMHALARIQHPGVLGILDVGELPDEGSYLVVEYVEGVSLRELLRGGPFAPARAARLIRQLGSALAASHAAGVAHLDLKPENVMIRNPSQSDETATLIDFGIAKVDRAGIDANVTMIAIGGTVRYMAPEQLEGVNTLACDVYALGLIASEMLCGKPDVRALPRGIRRAVRRELERAQAFEPADRPSDVRAWSESLAGAMTRDRRWLAAAGGGAAAALVFAFAVESRLRVRSEPEINRVIEKVGAFDPESEGFATHGDLAGTVVYNADRSGLDAWRTTSPQQGYYYRELTDRQKALALTRGWTLSTTMRVVQGRAIVAVDLGGQGRRFDIIEQIEGGQHVGRLQTQIVPSLRGLDTMLEGAASYRRFELRFDPELQTAELYVDGVKRLDGYRGHSQFQEGRGVLFGAVIYRSDRAIADFQSVRFDINP
jgi:tRNA A-37 threonylcarbamoyl transferase component Bud32